ncbi:hypothetical protein [Clostridium cellulovorans]|uniref:Uncharacterized protein n=1 Tax=Clostridium cellulovorans (strain ATCC 35296 / DSM 3052 / OCM 3 / 743B) TaxID=573061 RepID=D9SQM0_CLOC7|nr:hypothetical protein [Clostridium cellulovorans]ADL52226.1 hypothetical protein Clocel_2514 [Clostridium cellulovorans 743B]
MKKTRNIVILSITLLVAIGGVTVYIFNKSSEDKSNTTVVRTEHISSDDNKNTENNNKSKAEILEVENKTETEKKPKVENKTEAEKKSEVKDNGFTKEEAAEFLAKFYKSDLKIEKSEKTEEPIFIAGDDISLIVLPDSENEGEKYLPGVKCYKFISKSIAMQKNGGTGTLDFGIIFENGKIYTNGVERSEGITLK